MLLDSTILAKAKQLEANLGVRSQAQQGLDDQGRTWKDSQPSNISTTFLNSLSFQRQICMLPFMTHLTAIVHV